MHFPASNNAAKYEALFHDLPIATTLGIPWLKVLGDSLLVINQANKEWSCLNEKMMMYFQELRKLENNFNNLKYLHVLHGQNEVADELAKLGSSQAMVAPGVFMQELHELSISRVLSKVVKAVKSIEEATQPTDDKPESSNVMTVHLDWCILFMIYLKTRGLHENKDEQERLRQ
jgi:hypothetical protein